MTLTIVPFTLAYKGSRTYLHGPDLYDAVMDYLQVAEPSVFLLPPAVKFTFHHLAHAHCDLYYSLDGSDQPPAHPAVEFSIGPTLIGWLVETDRPVTERKAFDEQPMIDKAVITGQTIAADPHAACLYSSMEIIVSLTKKLHMAVCSSSVKWLFTSVAMQRPIQEPECVALRIELQQQLGVKHTKSAIKIAGKTLGEIYFTSISMSGQNR